MVGIGATVIYLIYKREKPIDLIPPEKALAVAESYCLAYQRRGKLPQGEIKVPAIYTLRKASNKPFRYEILIRIIDFMGINREYLAYIDCWNGWMQTCIPKPQGWTPEESPDYFTVIIPQERLY